MNSEIHGLVKLVNQDGVQHVSEAWHRAVLNDISLRLGDEGFPCPFSKNAFEKKLLRFAFVESIDATGIGNLAESLTQYVELSRTWDGSLNTAYPMVIAFSLRVAAPQALENYHAFGWRVLQNLHEVDPAPWPQDVGTNPDTATWSMCFNGMPLFCNMSHPAHVLRRSRNLGEHFLIIVNPRERFDVVAGDSPAGRKVRANIRKRIVRYDGMPHCPQLASYGAGSIEWWQYGVLDENTQRSDKCPFRLKPQEP